MNNPQNIIVHHSITPRDLDIALTERSIERTHKARGFPKSSLGWHIGYHYIIYGNGTLKQYRLDTDSGAHTKEQEMNFKSLGICLIGNFDIEDPSDIQVAGLANLLKQKVEQYKIPVLNIFPHRHFATYKSCYGAKLADDWAKKLIDRQPMKLINDGGTVYLVGSKGKIGLANLPFLKALEEITDLEVGSTAGIPQKKVIESVTGFIIKEQ